ncbi:MAG: chromosome segregation protein SMC [Nanoarchaeota archaeon]|nr:chromosome segregation protein SMC [Nanoarchaeota archaeon]
MTRINKLVLQGFKSFAKKTEIPFGPKFNCVLGPNGSGKSNILDAICFVLGKTSSKSLRAEKSANLIYNGGKAKNPSKEALVSISFDNSDRIFPIDAKEIVIARIVKGSGASVYKINEKKVTRNDVVELLSTAAINPDGYNIILQGDITQLVEMSPKERRGLVEEIAGIGIYEEKKQKAMNELSKVEEHLKEADIILAERQTYLRELKKERNQALKFKELDDNIKRNKATVLDINIRKKQEKKQGFEAQIKTTEDAISKIASEIADIKKQIEDKKEKIKEINREIEDKGDKDQVRIQKEIEELRIQIATHKSRIQSCETELERIQQRKSQLSESKTELDEKIKRLKLEKETIISGISEKKRLSDQLEAKIAKFKQKNKMGDEGNIEQEIADIDKEAEKKQVEIQAIREEQQNFLREKDRIEYQIQTADDKIEKVLSVEKENLTELKRLKQIKQEFKKATLDLTQRLNTDSSLSSQIGNARARAIKLAEEIGKLTARHASMVEKASVDIAIKKIIEQKNKIKGIHGIVSELGEVSSRFNTALGIAAGPKLKSIVVDTDKTAAECIKYLKQNKLGSATFLPLNKIRGVNINPDIRQIAKQGGVHGLAIDLVKYDSRFKNVFSYVFGATLVVETIDTARTIGIGRARMVSLDGDMAELSGAMRGGFRNKKAEMGFQEKEVKSGLDNLEKEEADTRMIINTLEKKKQENEDAISTLRELKANLEADIIKIEKSLHLESDDLEISKKLKDELKERLKEIEKGLDSVQDKVSGSNRELAGLKIKRQALREKISALKNPLLIAELNTFEQKKMELREEVIKSDSNVKNIDIQITTIMLPELGNTDKILKQHTKEYEAFKQEIDELTKKIKDQEKDLAVKDKSQKEFYTKFKALFKTRDGFSEEVSELEKELFKKEEARREKEQKKNIVSLENARISAELSGLLEEFKEFEGVKIFDDKDEEKIKKEIWQFEKMRQDIGAVNMRALEIYDKVEAEYNGIIDKKEKLSKEREDVLLMMNEIESKKKELFMKTYDALTDHFKNIFSQLSTKGDAFLELEDPETVFEGGLLIKVRLSGKKFLDIRSLSGGEKTMTALAFLYAVQEFQPASFYILDEVDAALDKRNSERLATLVRKYTANAQYIIISHNDGVIAEADNLYGISMDQHGISKVVSLRI